MTWLSSYCVAPKCQGEAIDGPFCVEHDKAPNTQKGGWLSAHKRRREVSIDASQVAPRLWIGAAPPVDKDLTKVDLLVLCAREIQPERLAFHGHILRCPLPDAEITNAELHRALDASRRVAQALVSGDRALVTCAIGINRSALVAALALGRITTMGSQQIIDLIRQRRRADCLSNPYFVAEIDRLVGDGRKQIVGRDRKPSIR